MITDEDIRIRIHIDEIKVIMLKYNPVHVLWILAVACAEHSIVTKDEVEARNMLWVGEHIRKFANSIAERKDVTIEEVEIQKIELGKETFTAIDEDDRFDEFPRILILRKCTLNDIHAMSIYPGTQYYKSANYKDQVRVSKIYGNGKLKVYEHGTRFERTFDYGRSKHIRLDMQGMLNTLLLEVVNGV